MPASDSKPPASLSTGELASRWGMKPGTLRTWRHKGKGPPFFRPNGELGHVRYRLDVIKQWELNNTDEPEMSAS